LALSLYASTCQRSICRICLLPAQLLHLLTSIAVSMSGLSGQISHLPFAGLLGREVRLLRRLLRGRSPLI